MCMGCMVVFNDYIFLLQRLGCGMYGFLAYIYIYICNVFYLIRALIKEQSTILEINVISILSPAENIT